MKKLEDALPILFAITMSVGPMLLHFALGYTFQTSILICWGSAVVAFAVLSIRELLRPQRRWDDGASVSTSAPISLRSIKGGR